MNNSNNERNTYTNERNGYNNERNGYNQEDDSMKLKDFVAGAVIGGLVGAAAALLLTPKSGRDIRDNLTDQAAVLKNKTIQLRDTAMVKGSEVAEMAKERAASLTQNVTGNTGNSTNSETEKSVNTELHQADPQYIPIPEAKNNGKDFDDLTLSDDQEVREKLVEAKKAFDEEESKIKQ